MSTLNERRRVYDKAQQRYETAVRNHERPNVIIALWQLALASEKALIRAEKAVQR